jgi:SAM-dependent methyltransferase
LDDDKDQTKERLTVVENKTMECGDEWIPYPRYLLRKHLVKKILRRENTSGKKCLEIGYGAGDMLLLYARVGLEAYGFDFSTLARMNASDRLAKNNELKRRIILYEKEADIEQIKYDYIMAYEVLEHIKDDAAALGKWVSLLGDGGKIILSVPAHKNKWGDSDIAVGHYRRYEKEELEELCKKCGIVVQYIWCYGFPLTILLDPLLHLSRKSEATDGCIASREDRSKESGVKRKKNILFRLLFNDFFLFPFYLLQVLFLNLDLGSGYIVVGEVRRKM